MRTSISKVLIVLVILAQLVWLVRPRFGHGEPNFDERYRGEKRVLAYAAWKEKPSSQTEAMWQEELKQLYAHTRTRDSLLLALVLAFDASLIYWLWNYGVKRDHGLINGSYRPPDPTQ